MAPVKRKRPQNGVDEVESAAPEATTRRATRQTSIAPLPIQPDPEPRRRRRRTNTNEEPVAPEAESVPDEVNVSFDTAAQSLSRPREKENLRAPSKASESKPTRGARQAASSTTATTAPPTARVNGNAAPIPAASTQRRRSNGTTKPAQIIEQHHHKVGQTKPITITTSAPDTTSDPSMPPKGDAKKPPSDRNIDKVLLGEICFKAWYPSPYSKEVLGDIPSPSASGSATVIHPVKDDQPTVGSIQNGGKGGGRTKDTPILDRLCVCPCCFKYSKELVLWWDHVQICRERRYMPGRKIYVHPQGERKVMVPAEGGEKSGKGKKGSGSAKMVEEVVRDAGEWSIWEVDGEKDVLFCQNLSLFAKLFLDNKSVFFDVTGFNYFLLVYTQPPTNDQPHPRRHIVGFFSKEKMSWDNNNLACILVFPPWQRKGLGPLLMGISYEISRREGLLGGPEKPISDLGKKGYRRFWAGEIARWLLGLEVDEVVDVEMCSQATWIAADDCLAVLREMGIVEEAGIGPPRLKKKKEGEGEEEVVETEVPPVKDVPRVRVSKDAVRQWVAENGISLERACDPSGFVEGYAMKPEETVEEAEEEE